jgi:CheY-like chemotaxis protein/HPt (histidine-containing phosphotransfer) domain-containing protein
MAVGRLLANEPDITVHCCHKAFDAVSQANRLAPSLILQDLQMPDIDGLTLVGQFRRNPATANTPIIMLSGNDDAPSRARATESGANDYLVKLPSKDSLIASIRRTLAAPAGGALSETPVHAAPAASAGNLTFDRSVLLAICAEFDDAQEFIAMMIDTFLADGAVQVETLVQAGAAWDVPVLKTAAHSLKGASLSIGATKLGGMCAQLEQHLERQPSALVKALLIKALSEEFGRARIACLLERDGADRTPAHPASHPAPHTSSSDQRVATPRL